MEASVSKSYFETVMLLNLTATTTDKDGKGVRVKYNKDKAEETVLSDFVEVEEITD